MSARLRLQAAQEFLTAARKHPVSELPPSVLRREDAELRRQLGQVLGIVNSSPHLSAGDLALAADALEVAADTRRYRATIGCPDCLWAAAVVCETHTTDLQRAREYDQLADRIREAIQ